jgi:DNA topoisomerase-6 subunit A
MADKKSRPEKSETTKRARDSLVKMGNDILKDIENKKNPKIEIPIRSFSNIVYDDKSKSLTLGDKSSKRFLFNVAHAKKFMQTTIIAAFCKKLLDERIHTSLRDMYYNLKRTLPESNENTFDEQSESDPIIVDLEVALDVLREKLHLSADVRGRVVGSASIVDRGDVVDWSRLGSGGWAIPSNVEEIEFKKVDAKFILVIEKNAAFERLHEDKFWDKHKCILVTTQGQPARGCRRLIQRLSEEYKLPVYVFCDSDPYGWYIYSVIKYGSMSLAHVSDRLGTPNAKYIGLTLSDIDKFGLEKYTIKAKDVDIKRAKDMMKYEWFQSKAWQNELKLLMTKKLKAELEALSGRGLRFMTEEYLPQKIKNKEFIS